MTPGTLTAMVCVLMTCTSTSAVVNRGTLSTMKSGQDRLRKDSESPLGRTRRSLFLLNDDLLPVFPLAIKQGNYIRSGRRGELGSDAALSAVATLPNAILPRFNVDDYERTFQSSPIVYDGDSGYSENFEEMAKRTQNKHYVRFGRSVDKLGKANQSQLSENKTETAKAPGVSTDKRTSKQYVRFGRNFKDIQDTDETQVFKQATSRFEGLTEKEDDKRAPKQYVRYGRSSESIEEDKRASKQYVRFGRGSGDTAEDKRAPKQYVRFGRGSEDIAEDKRAPKQYVRFGRGSEDTEEDKRAPKQYVRYGRGSTYANEVKRSPKQYVRFGRVPTDSEDNERSPKQYVRYGRNAQKQYVRFGRGSVDNEDEAEQIVEHEINLANCATMNDRNCENTFSGQDGELELLKSNERNEKRNPKQYVRFGRSQDSDLQHFLDTKFQQQLEMQSGATEKRAQRQTVWVAGNKEENSGPKRAQTKQYVRFGKRQQF